MSKISQEQLSGIRAVKEFLLLLSIKPPLDRNLYSQTFVSITKYYLKFPKED